MSKDIRSFFAPVSSNKGSKLVQNTKKRVYNVISSDSDDDALFEKQRAKKTRSEKHTTQVAKKQKDAGEKGGPSKTPTPVDVSSFFGQSPIQQKPQTLIKPNTSKPEQKRSETKTKERKSKGNKKRAHSQAESSDIPLENHFDDDFEATLSLLDEDKLGITPKKMDSKASSSEEMTPARPEVTPKTKTKADNSRIKTTPKNESPNTSIIASSVEKTKSLVDSEQKKKGNIEAYQKFLNRKGPINPGSKEIPEGAPNCLKGKTFVITGEMESLGREEATELIQKYGGRCTTSVSRKTTYIILGDEPGVSKLQKAEQLKTEQLSENGLLDLIRKSFTGKKAEPAKSTLNGSAQKSDILPKREGSVSKAKKLKFDDPKIDSVDSGFGSSCSVLSSLNGVEPLEVSAVKGDSLWVEKYKPQSTKTIIGQNGEKSNVKKLTKWLLDWHGNHSGLDKKKAARPAPWAQGDDGKYFKAALLSGPPGVGKTTSVHLVCRELGFDIVEFNASDTRSKRLLSQQVSELLSSKSIRNYYAGDGKTKQHVLVMDEVDGMAGNEDRGGIQELIQLIKNTQTPVICMCNDRNHQKMRSLVNYCFDLRFNRPRVEQIKGAMMSICYKEGIKISGDTLSEIIVSANQDIRQVMHNLSLWAVKDKGLSPEQAKLDANRARKTLKMGPWDVARQVFSQTEQQKTSFREKEELFFQDYSLGPLFVQDTYIHVKPFKAKGDKTKTLECLSRAADSLAWGDVTERMIRSQNAWSLLPVQAVFASVAPGREMAGHIMGQISFPAWLGKNSKRNKFDRLLQELHIHTRLNTSGSKKAVNLDYSQPLRNAILRPMIKNGLDGVAKSVEIMKKYQLLREDVDSLVEICQWPSRNDPFSTIEAKVKSAFTRAYNKECPATPYAATTIKKTKIDDTQLVDETEDGENSGDEEDDNEDVSLDAMIKKGKGKKQAAGKKEAPGTSHNEKKPKISRKANSSSKTKSK